MKQIKTFFWKGKSDFKFDDIKTACLFKNEIILKLQQRFKNAAHCVYTEEINKIALMMKKDCKLLTELQHIHMEQMLLKYVKVRC